MGSPSLPTRWKAWQQEERDAIREAENNPSWRQTERGTRGTLTTNRCRLAV